MIEACNNLEKLSKQRTQVTDTKKVNEYIESKLKNKSQLLKYYQRMQDMSEILTKVKDSYYREDPYQAYVGACLIYQ